jgi:hypothetical protein
VGFKAKASKAKQSKANNQASKPVCPEAAPANKQIERIEHASQ